MWVCFCVFYPVLLICMSVFVPILHCFDYLSFAVFSDVWESYASCFVFCPLTPGSSIEMIMWFLTSVNVVCDIDWFANVEPPLWIWDEFHLFIVYDLFLWIVGFDLLIFCWEFLHLYSSKILAYNFLFSVVSLF